MINEEIARRLLQIKAFIFNPDEYFTWASGIKSPVYCDNRLALSYPQVRNLIIEGFVQKIKKHCPKVETIAGVATAGIPYASLIAQKMNLPLVYVRNKPKEHGRKNRIEGFLPPRNQVVVIEDLISQGESALEAVNAIKEEKAEVLGVFAAFSYGLEQSQENFAKANMPFYVLTDFETLMKQALNSKYLAPDDMNIILEWHKQL